ncbi:hypothetical protein [Lactobacillus johnsonii]|uniref:hypothetical protein n=1 Tax=Lactobacillus johnsonii TaxID=33959 RepID=UPI00107E8834|nr:hypothetical protein [Lactobacillus johnsonii]TGA93540.1 hypothetical protein E5F86_08075 [Lactobacillus johnsonii]
MEISKLFELEADILLASELLVLTPFSSDLLFPFFDKSVCVLSDTDPTICDLASTEVCAAYTRSLGKIAAPVAPVPKIAAKPASSLRYGLELSPDSFKLFGSTYLFLVS